MVNLLMRVFSASASGLAVSLTLAACGGNGSTLAPSSPSLANPIPAKKAVGLGYVVTAKGGYQIDGFGVDLKGSDGVLSTGAGLETFDQDSGAIIKAFPGKIPKRTSFGMAGGVTTGGVALVTRWVVPKGTIYAKRFYDVANPITANQFTGAWKSPIKDFQVEQTGPNQTAPLTAIYGIEIKNQDNPDLIISNIANNTISKVFPLSSEFALGHQPQLAQDTALNEAVFALSPDGGAAGGEPPVNILINMKTGKSKQFGGFNNGYEHAGDVNGLAVDSATGVAATTTQLNAQVEFYNIATQSGIVAVQLPCTGSSDEGNSGRGIASDSIHGLFLVTEPSYCYGSSGSAIVVYDEKGNLVETLTGFNFAIAEPAPVINPTKRMGWVLGPKLNMLQEFTY